VRRAGWLAAYVAASFLAFPHPLAGRVLDLGVVFAWLAPAALLLGISGLPVRRAAWLGFLASLAAHSAILHWIYVVTVDYGHAPAIVGVLAPVALAVYIAGFGALFSAGAAALSRGGAACPVGLAALWTACDHLRSFALSGFPWATLGYAQHLNAALLPLASFGGVYALSFVSALGGAALARIVLERRVSLAAGVALLFVALAHAGGLALRASEDDEAGLTRLRVAVLQGNIDQGVKWSPDRAESTLKIYEDLSRRAAERGARLIVWPETAVPGPIDRMDGGVPRFERLARETGAALVVGAVGLDLAPDQTLRGVTDSAYVFDPSGALVHRYDKTHLVPFGEYVPLQDALGRVFRAVARGIAEIGVTPGETPRALAFPVPGEASPLTAGVPICYELLFPDLMRRFVRDGAQVLFAITNDAWYGRTGAPYQFLAITALRSAESRVWTARAANTGVSAIIDARGEVRSRTRIFERGLLVEDVTLRPAPAGGSFYTRHGDAFAGACWAGALLSLAAAWRRGRQRGTQERDA
jgi:apolipoprotein N-acyltransferase